MSLKLLQAKGCYLVARFMRGARLAVLACAWIAAAAASAQGNPVKGDVRVTTSGGYARIVFHLAEEVESTVKLAGGIVVVSFKRPVEIPVERIVHAAPGYAGAARRDPDGRGLRIALSRKVTINSMAAGERLFIDLLPENWSGLPPGLPQEVIEDLARRARDAERLLRKQRAENRQNVKATPVRVGVQPTFTRYLFDLPEATPVSTERGKDTLTLSFAAPLKFDMGDAKATLPPVVKSIDAVAESDSTVVKFVFADKADIRSFREDNSYVVDVSAMDGKPDASAPRGDAAAALTAAAKKLGPLDGVEAPQTVPAKVPVARAPQQAAPAPHPAPAAPHATPPVSQPAPEPEKLAPQPHGKPHAQSTAAPPDAPSPDAESAEQKPEREEARTPSSPAEMRAPKVAAAAHPAPPPPPPVVRRPERKPHGDAVAVELVQQGDGLAIVFPFDTATPMAAFRRADTLWLIFDSKKPFDLSAFQDDTSQAIRSVQGLPLPDGQAVRIKLERPRLVSALSERGTWTITIGEAVADTTKPLGLSRNVIAPSRANVSIPFENASKLHRIADPDVGDMMLAVTALGPVRGLVKPQDFVEFHALATTQGIAIRPIADDVQVEVLRERIVIGKPGGLVLSNAVQSDRKASLARPIIFDSQLWGFDRQSNFTDRQYKLVAAAAEAGDTGRTVSRLELARFYLARDMFPEAKGVLDIAIAEERPTPENPAAHILRAISNIMLDRPEQAFKELSTPAVGEQLDAALWRAFALARLGRWQEAHQGFRNAEAAIPALPVELQRVALKEVLRSAIEIKDYSDANRGFTDFETIGLPREMLPEVQVLMGRLAQGLGRNVEALRNYRGASDSGDRKAAAQGKLREIALRFGVGELKRQEVIGELETLTALWRGDETEIEALQILGRLYTEEGRYRDAFHVMRTALKAHPNSEMTRRIQEEAAVTFDSLFLAGRSDALPAIDALSLFYDFRELTPIGRRGDEMIRRLADRLVSVDLLFQASELLQHQIENRLQGAARAQVATRLAVIYLMDRKPDRAQNVLKSTRVTELPSDLRQLRLLLEARALSDIGRHDLALEVISSMERREAVRLRSDILWAMKRFGDAAEQIELLYGERFRQFEPLSDSERSDILRAAIGYGLAEDMIGLQRFREKYSAKMGEGPDRRTFEIATAPLANSAAFREIAKQVAASDTLTSFLREMRASYPEIGTFSAADPLGARIKTAERAEPEPNATGSILPERMPRRP
jgi:tetratricopeptide (TPR) repeat protein